MGDQLLQCPDTDLRKAIHRALGVRVATINMADRLTEIETLAVIKQSNHVNILTMIKSKQERDEPVRQFSTRLRGLAAVCDLAALCTCGLSVSMVDKWVLMTLINGLYDGDTQQAVLSKVTEMNLEDTIVFVEAREVGTHSVKVLSGGLSSSQVSRVTEDQGKCKFCGQSGHGRNPNSDIRKTDCPAFGKQCKNCKRKGHFPNMCLKKKTTGEKSPQDATKTTAGSNSMNLSSVYMSKKFTRSNVSQISQTVQNLMKKQQNVKKLRHEVWSEEAQTYIKSSLPEEPILKQRMCLDILPYKKHDPPLDCNVQKSWVESLGPSKQQVDIVLKTIIADTGSQCFLLGNNPDT